MSKIERVNHPKHYNSHPSGIECIQIIEHMPLNVGTAIKYLWRAGLKDDAPTDEDYRKAIWYIERERTRLDGIRIKQAIADGKKDQKESRIQQELNENGVARVDPGRYVVRVRVPKKRQGFARLKNSK